MMEEEITPSWLRSIGFTRHMQPAGSNELSYKNITYCGERNHPFDRTKDSTRWYKDGIIVYPPKTREEVLKLCGL